MDLNDLDLNLLRTLHALLEESSVHRAAERLGRTPPATSHALARLRDRIGDPLLVRAGRGMVRTARAEALRPVVAGIMEAVGDVFRDAGPVTPGTLEVSFRLRATDHVIAVLYPTLDRMLRAAAPGVSLVTTPNTTDDAEALSADQVDVAIGVFRDLPPELRMRRLFDDRFVCVVRRGHPRLDRLSDLDVWCNEDHVLTSPRGRPGSAVDAVLAAEGRSRRVSRVVPYFLGALALVADSDAVLTVSRRLALLHAATFDLALVEPPIDMGRGYTLSMLWHPRRDADPVQRWLRAQVVAAAEALPSAG